MQRYTLVETSIGPVGIVASAAGLSHIYLMRRSTPDANRRMERLHPDAVRDDELLPGLREDLVSYFSGKPVRFDVQLDLGSCTEFQRRVLRACARVEYGQTVSYGELARRIGCPAGARAVGGALARNPVPLVIPCHRVLAGGGLLGGFSAEDGLKVKRFLLDLEASGVGREAIAPSTGKPRRARINPPMVPLV